MPELTIKVRQKIARVSGTPQIVCGNSDYAAIFDFDHEWESYDAKTARIVWMDRRTGKFRHEDVLFEGDSALLPPIYDTDQVVIGVYAGDIHTTTPARVPCIGCITDGAPYHPDPPEDAYKQLLKYLKRLSKDGSIPENAVMLTSFPEDAPETGIPECISEPVAVTVNE